MDDGRLDSEFFLKVRLFEISSHLNAEKKYFLKKLASGQFQTSLQIRPLLKKIEFLGAQNALLDARGA